MTAEFAVLVLVFWSLAFINLKEKESRKLMLSRSNSEWILDLAGLSIHGIIVPLVQTLLIAGSLSFALGDLKSSIRLPGLVAFSINFVVVDYLYYWNHRLLHSQGLWRFHSVHHSGTSFDVFMTSRNSALSTFLILYVWVNGIFLFILENPMPYALGILASNCLDMVRHVRLQWWPDIFPLNFITSPRDHAWHHSRDVHGVNFGGNLNIWDKIHGTYWSSKELPDQFGEPLPNGRIMAAFWKGLP